MGGKMPIEPLKEFSELSLQDVCNKIDELVTGFNQLHNNYAELEKSNTAIYEPLLNQIVDANKTIPIDYPTQKLEAESELEKAIEQAIIDLEIESKEWNLQKAFENWKKVRNQ